MKKIRINFIALVLQLIINFSLLFSQNEMKHPSVFKKATFYQNGAEITFSANVELKKGNNKIMLDSIISSLDKNSIRITSVKGKYNPFNTDFYQEAIDESELQIPANIKKLEDSLNNIKFQIDNNNNRIIVLDNEEKLILSFKLENSSKEVLTPMSELTSLAAYYNTRLNEIKKEKLTISRENDKLIKLQTALTKKYNKELSIIKPKPNYIISFEVNSEEAKQADFNITFYTSLAGWTPYYEIRAESVEKSPLLIYRANVWQNSGKDWKDVEISISTRNPALSGIIPVLYPWYLQMIYTGSEVYEDASPLVPEVNVRGSRGREQKMTVKGLQIGTVESKYLTMEYNPSGRYTILCNNKMHSITLNEREMKATYEHYAVPKLEPEAFLVAKISDWSDYGLLSGETYIYFENNFIGKSKIDPNQTIDTMTVSLGKDRGITITREKIQDYTETRFLSSRIEKSFGYKIKIKNNKKSAIKIKIEDQYPLSTHEDIEIEILDTSNGTIDKERGVVSWILELEPNKIIEKVIAFKIIAPNNINFY